MNMDVEMDMERMSERMSITNARPVLQGVPQVLTFLQNVLVTED